LLANVCLGSLEEQAQSSADSSCRQRATAYGVGQCLSNRTFDGTAGTTNDAAQGGTGQGTGSRVTGRAAHHGATQSARSSADDQTHAATDQGGATDLAARQPVA